MLSPKEKEILSHFCLGNKEISKLLFLERSTIQTHFTRMCARFNAKNRHHLFFKALKNGDIRKVDLGFWDEEGKYHPDWYIVDLRKE